MRYVLVLAAALLLGLDVTAVEKPATASAPATQETGSSLGEPNWPIGFKVPDDLAGKRKNQDAVKADVLVWTPPDAKRIRAVMLIPNNSDSKNFGEYAGLRAVLVKHETAIVYLRTFNPGVEHTPNRGAPEDPNRIFRLLKMVADATGIAEFNNAPWINFGKSSRGEFPFRMAWLFPERMIASVSYHGETPSWTLPDWAKPQTQTILEVNANGQVEWDGTWYRHVRPSLLNYRKHTAWLPHQVVAYGVGHGNYVDASGSKGWGQPVPENTMSVLRVWDYLSLFIDKALTLRLPENGYPTDKPFELRQVDPASGYLIHKRAIEVMLGMKWMALWRDGDDYKIVAWPEFKGDQFDDHPGTVDRALLVRKASDVPEAERLDYFWVADKELADAWIRLHNIGAR